MRSARIYKFEIILHRIMDTAPQIDNILAANHPRGDKSATYYIDKLLHHEEPPTNKLLISACLLPAIRQHIGKQLVLLADEINTLVEDGKYISAIIKAKKCDTLMEIICIIECDADAPLLQCCAKYISGWRMLARIASSASKKVVLFTDPPAEIECPIDELFAPDYLANK